MKILIYLFFLIPAVAIAQNDLNYEFVTSGHAEIDMSFPGALVDTLTILHAPVRVIKQHNNLVIVSNSDPGNVKMNTHVRFLGRSTTGALVYDTESDVQLRMHVYPLDGIITIRKIETGKVVAVYGSNPMFIPIAN